MPPILPHHRTYGSRIRRFWSVLQLQIPFGEAIEPLLAEPLEVHGLGRLRASMRHQPLPERGEAARRATRVRPAPSGSRHLASLACAA
jgi:hypothetical protein